MKTVGGFRVHPVAEIFPLLDADELQDLADDIAKNGQKVPILLHPDGRILDGRNRALACDLVNVYPRVEEYYGDESTPALVQHVLSLNLARRHLAPGQRANAVLAAESLVAKLEEEARARMLAGKTHAPEAHVPQGSRAPQSRDTLAKLADVSARTIQNAKKVRDSGDADLVSMVERGDVAVRPAAEVASLPEPERRAVVEAGPKAIVEKAKQVRETRREKADPTILWAAEFFNRLRDAVESVQKLDPGLMRRAAIEESILCAIEMDEGALPHVAAAAARLRDIALAVDAFVASENYTSALEQIERRKETA